MCRINGKKLGEIRVNKGVSQSSLAEQVGVSRQSVSQYENGVCEPSTETVERICLFLNINRSDIEIHDVGFVFSHGESKTVAHARKQKGFVRFLKPSLVETFIEEKRKNKEKEKEEVKARLNHSISFGNKKYILVNPTLIHIPEWQRDTDMAKCIEITENFKEEQFDPIKVYVKNGKLYVADGAHRVVAFINREEVEILVEVLNCTENEAALIFLQQSSGRKSMSFADTYRAGIQANSEEYLMLKYFFESHNIQITKELNKLENPIGSLTPSRAVLRMLKNDEETLSKVVEIIKKLEWTGSKKNAFSLRNLEVLKQMYINFGDDVESRLLENCKGVVFYESKVVPVKSNAELFDILSMEISK